jgi:hypothetical protein
MRYITITSGNIVFSKAIGQDTSISHTTYALEAQRRYHIRARYYIPQSIDAIGVVRNINFDIAFPGSSGTDLRYNYLYSDQIMILVMPQKVSLIYSWIIHSCWWRNTGKYCNI